MDSLFFTVYDPETLNETRINVAIKEDGNFAINNVAIDAQQLAELGMLFFALANRGGTSDVPDLDSCNALLDGFDIPVPVKALEKVLNA